MSGPLQMCYRGNGPHMATDFFEKPPTSLRLEMFTVLNEGFQQWDPVPKSAEAKVFLVITAEDVSDGAFVAQLIGLSLNGLRICGRTESSMLSNPPRNSVRSL